MKITRRWSLGPWQLLIIVLIFAGVVRLLVANWQFIRSNLDLLHALCVEGTECTIQLPHGPITLKESSTHLIDSPSPTACQSLWQSRTLATGSLLEARRALDMPGDCKRSSLVAAWAGNLAWLEGNEPLSETEWAQLSEQEIYGWAQQLVNAGEYAQGSAMLEAALATGPGGADTRFWTLKGDIYRLQGDWQEARLAYEEAWSLSKEDLRLGLYLAISYRETGNADQARALLQEILKGPPAGAPWLAAALFEELERVQLTLGDEEAAAEAARQAAWWHEQN